MGTRLSELMKGSATPVPNTETKSLPVALGYSLLNWLVPGLGFFLVKDRFRGVLLFVLINGIFALGLFFDGYVYVPSLKLGPEFNVVAILTFFVQASHGFGTGILLFLDGKDWGIAKLLVRAPGAPYSDLGSFHLLVAGGLNYFASVRLYDLLRGYEEPKSPSEMKKSANANIEHDSATSSKSAENKGNK